MYFVYLINTRKNPATAEKTEPFLGVAMTKHCKTIAQTL